MLDDHGVVADMGAESVEPTRAFVMTDSIPAASAVSLRPAVIEDLGIISSCISICQASQH